MNIRQKLAVQSASTVERPRFLEADALARYHQAAKYCKGKEVLDIGTGFGIGAEYIATHGAKRVLGLDYSRSAIESFSASETLKNNKNIDLQVLNALELEKLKKKFDVILAFEIIEHLPIHLVDTFLKEIKQHLKPGGTFLLSTPNGLKTKFVLGKPYNPFHIIEYKPVELQTILKKQFSKSSLYGFRCINKKHLKKEKEIEKTINYKIAYYLGHFRFIRNLLGYIPTDLKRSVTKENVLQTLGIKDYIVDKNISDSEGLFAVIKK